MSPRPPTVDAPPAPATKTTLRRELAARRAAIDPDSADRAAARAADRLLALPVMADLRRVFTCLSFGTELDTLELVERLLAEGREVYVPRADPADRSLHVHRFPCALETLSFGLRQPPAGTPEVPAPRVDATVDVALVLGLGFDRRGFRLGYGGGYFDRFLRGRPFPTIGIAHHSQLVEALPAEAHDVPMTAVVTDRETLWVGAPGPRSAA